MNRCIDGIVSALTAGRPRLADGPAQNAVREAHRLLVADQPLVPRILDVPEAPVELAVQEPHLRERPCFRGESLRGAHHRLQCPRGVGLVHRQPGQVPEDIGRPERRHRGGKSRRVRRHRHGLIADDRRGKLIRRQRRRRRLPGPDADGVDRNRLIRDRSVLPSARSACRRSSRRRCSCPARPRRRPRGSGG